MMLPKPVAILKDWDGTVVDSMGHVHHCVDKALSLMNMQPATREQVILTAVYGRTCGSEVWGMNEADNATFVSHFDREYFVFSPEFTLMPHALEFYQSIPADIHIGVVSNGLHSLIDQQITHLGWHERMKVVVCAGDAALNKPHPDPIWHALKLLDVPVSKSVWFIGDTQGDIRAANAAGVTSILVCDHAYDGPAPDFHFPDMRALHTAALSSYGIEL